MIERLISSEITKKLFKGKAIIVSGARQVGKTTLVKHISAGLGLKSLYLNCDEPDIKANLSSPTSTLLKQLIGDSKLLIIDEAQRVEGIGITAKLIVDQIKDVQLILTGSSALEMGSRTNEPLTGRKFEFHLSPFSFGELSNTTSTLEESRLIEQRMIYGYYPEVVNNPGEEPDRLLELSSSYLYKDIFSLGSIKKPQALEKLLMALALQFGSQVSTNELSGLVGIDKNTITNYIDLLEKTYVIYSLNSLSTNQRNELKRSRKIYFWDLGIRNAIIKNFNPVGLREDTGALWENFVINERLKYLMNTGKKVNKYFWRTYQQQEVDYIEEWGGKYSAFEIKWNTKAKTRHKKIFMADYPDSDFATISRENFPEFVM